MAVSKVILNDNVLIDLTNDTVTAAAVMSGVTAHNAYGESITGTITARTSSDVTVAGPTVSIPSGVYSVAVSTTIPNATLRTPLTLGGSPQITVSNSGLITARYGVSGPRNIATASGYVTNTDQVEIAINTSNTYQLPVKAATTYTPTTSDQTIAAGSYLTGAQTVKGDANLIAENIASGVTIFGITGTHSGGRNPSISDISYTGNMQILEDNDDVWEVAFLDSGTLTIPNTIQIDAFLLGGGGGGGSGYAANYYSGGGGGGGYTVSTTLTLAAGSYPIVIGAGGEHDSDGGDTTAFSSTANGGKKGGTGNSRTDIHGGPGGSGGGGGTQNNGTTPGIGGSDGANGTSGHTYRGPGGAGQGISTRAYGEANNTLYAGGGGGGGSRNTAGSSSPGASGGSGGGANGGNVGNNGSDAAVNTGGGGGGGGCRNANNTSPGVGGRGGSGIVRIRTHRVS